MKKLFIVSVSICLLVCSKTSLAQKLEYMGNGGTMRFFEMYDTEGQPIKTASQTGATGTPMLQPGWGKGKVVYRNGQTFSSDAINFSVFDNKLFYVNNQKLFTIVLPVESFTITYPSDENDSVTYHFVSGFPAVDGQTVEHFYEVVTDGKNLRLLKYHQANVKEVFSYGNTRTKEFGHSQQWYVYFPKDDKIVSVQPSLSALSKTLPDYSGSIKAYGSANHFKPKEAKALANLFTYLDNNK